MAVLRRVELSEDGENIAAVTIRISLPELVMLARVTGKLNGPAIEQIWAHPIAQTATSGLYDAATHALNAFYDAGVDDAARTF